MGYIVIENFKFGLDTRRLDLGSKPGVLVDLENAHIDQGGQVEKRKAFVRTLLALTASSAPVTTFGLTSLRDSMEVYGTASESGIDAPSIPTNITYRQLVRSLPVAATSSISHTVTAVIHSTTFANKSVVVATLSDGSTIIFYDGVAIVDFDAGLVRSWGTNTAGILRRLGVAISDTNFYTATYSSVTGLLSVFGLPGASYSISIVKVSAAGTLTEQKISNGVPATPASLASGYFKVFAGSVSAGVNKISQIVVGATNLLASAVDFAASTVLTAEALVTAINANTFTGATSGYRATGESSLVRIFSATTGTTPNDKAISTTAAGDVCLGRCIVSFAGTGFNLNYINANGINILSAVLTFPAFGGQTLSAYVTSIAANIRAGSATHGYTALASGVVLYIAKLVTLSSDVPIKVDIEVIPTAGNTGVVFEGTDIGNLVSVSKNTVFFTRDSPLSSTWLSDSVTVNPVGGVPPYSFAWPNPGAIAALSSQSRIVRLTPIQPTAQSCQYRLFASSVGTRPSAFIPSGSFVLRCVVTDALGVAVESPDITYVMPGSGNG